jgi:hypothetical protein
MKFSIRDLLWFTVVAAVAVWSWKREHDYRAMQTEVLRLRQLYVPFPGDIPPSYLPVPNAVPGKSPAKP